MKMGLEAKVGFFVVACFVLIAVMSLKVADLGIGGPKGYEVKAIMENAAGLAKDSPVIMSGVEIGTIKEIALEDGKAIVYMVIKEEYKVPVNVAVQVRSKGFLGEKYAELVPYGKATDEKLKDGATIVKSAANTDLDELGNKFGLVADDIKEITQALKEVLASEKGKDDLKVTLESIRMTTEALKDVIASDKGKNDMKVTLDSIRAATEGLKEIILANQQRVNNILINFEKVSKNLQQETPQITKSIKSASKNVDEIILGKRPAIEESLENIKNLTSKLHHTVDNVNVITDKMAKGEGSLGKLINDNETVDNLNEALVGLKKTFTKLDSLQVYLDFQGEQYFRRNESKGHVNVKIVPNKKRYYLLGLSNHPDGRTVTSDKYYSETHYDGSANVEYDATTKEKTRGEMTYTLQYAHSFFDGTYFRIGMKESEFGVGLDYTPSIMKKLTLYADLYDFPSKDEKNRYANLKTTARYQFHENFFATAGFDDVINNDTRSVFLGIGVLFRDDDLKYLIGQAPIPTGK